MGMPSSIAVFDADGVCVGVSAHPGRQPPRGAKAQVPAHTRPDAVWWDGKAVRESEPAQVELPAAVALGAQVGLELPANTVADVNGARQRGTLTVPTGRAGQVWIELRGARRGTFTVEVRDYAAARRAEYPSLADQIDALWKGGDAAEAMRRRVAAVKARHPKG